MKMCTSVHDHRYGMEWLFVCCNTTISFILLLCNAFLSIVCCFEILSTSFFHSTKSTKNYRPFCCQLPLIVLHLFSTFILVRFFLFVFYFIFRVFSLTWLQKFNMHSNIVKRRPKTWNELFHFRKLLPEVSRA